MLSPHSFLMRTNELFKNSFFLLINVAFQWKKKTVPLLPFGVRLFLNYSF